MLKKAKQVISLLLAMVLVIGVTIAGQPQRVSAESLPYLKLFYFNTEGDSTLMLLKTEKQTYSILIDAGESGLMGKLRYSSLYNQLEFGSTGAHENEKVLDYVFITHPHDDHTNGLLDILNSPTSAGGKGFVIRNLIINNKVGSAASIGEKNHSNDLEKTITKYSGSTSSPKKVIKTTYVQPGSGMVNGTIGGLLSYTYMPSPKVYETTNNTSMIIKFSYKGNNFVFSGDIGDRIEDKIVNGVRDTYYGAIKDKLQAGSGETTYLKLPHHGSRRVSTSYVKDSSFNGFPTADIIEDFINNERDFAANYFTKNSDGTYTFNYLSYNINALYNRDELYNKVVKGGGRLIGIGNVKDSGEPDKNGPISDTMSCFALSGLDEYHDTAPGESIDFHMGNLNFDKFDEFDIPESYASGETFRVVK